jgi:penicillin amidase
LAVVAACAFAWGRSRIAASLPILDGGAALPGLSQVVRVERDSLGVPTVTASSREDVARATGWLHAQDRFFQMDLLRRKGAGELAELFGPAALSLDREARMHGFRRLAGEVLARESPERRSLATAYADGVNAGLQALGATPWEYAVLRTRPRPWLPEDCVLITYAMTLDLQDGTGQYPRALAAVRDTLGPASLAFFAPLQTPADAALDGSGAPQAPMPSAAEVDLRRRTVAPTAMAPESWDLQGAGSNSLAVSGSLGAGGAAIVANDMHLHLGVPNTWYRMRLRWPGHDEAGVTLPGAPALVAGSTGHVAWGFTNSNAGTGDVIVVSASISPELYHGPDGGTLLPYEHRVETVNVRGGKPVQMEFTWTVWGPVVGDAPNGKQYVYHWTADNPAATNFNLVDLEDAQDASQAAAIAHRSGIPAQNFVVADSAGRIEWTLAGYLPRRVGYDGRLPVSWAFGDRRWDGFQSTGEVPVVASPPAGYLWTANNRPIGGASLAAVGDAGFDMGSRARQIRDDLASLAAAGHPVTPKDLIGVELDDRARFLARWKDILLGFLTPAAVAGKPDLQALAAAAQDWDGTAGTSSVGYRVVRAFRLAVAHRALDPIFAPCVDADPGFRWTKLNYEGALETLLEKRPENLLDPAYRTWDELLVAAAGDVSRTYARDGLDPRTATWGQRNVARIEHPFAMLLPHWAAGWLAMPADPLPGDSNMPRVQDNSFGASERFAVSPGREASGIFHMPGGQCANPLSPYFRAGHEAWVRGDATPFLPGPAEHTVELRPSRSG